MWKDLICKMGREKGIYSDRLVDISFGGLCQRFRLRSSHIVDEHRDGKSLNCGYIKLAVRTSVVYESYYITLGVRFLDKALHRFKFLLVPTMQNNIESSACQLHS